MSASILRNLVSSIFDIPATKIRLSGELSPNYVPEFNPQTDYDGSEDFDSIWGFCPKKGFVPIAVTHSDSRYLKEDMKRPDYFSDGTTIFRYLSKARHYSSIDSFEGVEKFAFFIIHNKGVRYANVWEISDEWDTWTLFKAPDFQKHWAAIESADIQRLEKWLSV